MGLNNEITFANEVVPDFGVRWVDAGAVVAKMKEEGADEEELREYLEVVEDLEAKQQEQGDHQRVPYRLRRLLAIRIHDPGHIVVSPHSAASGMPISLSSSRRGRSSLLMTMP